MRVRLHDGAVKFLAAADPFFQSDPFNANVITVIAARIAAGIQHLARGPGGQEPSRPAAVYFRWNTTIAGTWARIMSGPSQRLSTRERALRRIITSFWGQARNST